MQVSRCSTSEGCRCHGMEAGAGQLFSELGWKRFVERHFLYPVALQMGRDPVSTKNGGETIGPCGETGAAGGAAMKPAEFSFIICQRE